MTFSSRRSGEGARTGDLMPRLLPRDEPQSPQNRLSARLPLPQAPHCQGKGVPQSPQNFLSLAMLAPQRVQFIRVSNRPDGSKGMMSAGKFVEKPSLTQARNKHHFDVRECGQIVD
jgi:hypothetical protein